MRVTNSMLTAQVILNLGRNLERFARIEEQLSSTRRINRPSDDPIGTVRVLEYRHQEIAIDQYQKDIQFGLSWLSTTDSALSAVNNLLIEAYDMVVNLSNDTIGDDQRDSLAGRVDAIIEQVLEAANRQVGDRYVFSGTLTDRPAIIASSSGVVFNGNSERIRTKINNGNYVDLNTLGIDTFTRAFTTLGKDFDLEPALTAATRITDLNAGLGIQQVPGLFKSKRVGIDVALGVYVLNIQKYAIIVASAVGGTGVIIYTLLALFNGTLAVSLLQNPVRLALDNSIWWLLFFLVVAGLGIVAQIQANRSFEAETYNRLSEV